jgi:hypothetical protein
VVPKYLYIGIRSIHVEKTMDRSISLQAILLHISEGIEKQIVSVQIGKRLIMIPPKDPMESNLVKTQPRNILFKLVMIGSNLPIFSYIRTIYGHSSKTHLFKEIFLDLPHKPLMFTNMIFIGGPPLGLIPL